MLNWSRVGGLTCLWLIACGGKLIEGPAQGHAGNVGAGVPGAGGLGSSMSSGGAELGGGRSPAGGQAGVDAQPACLGDDPYIYCAAGCGSPATDAVIGECVNGEWRCPAPFIDAHTCPAESCVLQAVRCCDHVFGKTFAPECGPDGLFAACPAGFERNAPVCVADSAQTVNCGTLEGKSCSLEEAMCDAQGAHCNCSAADGGLVWSCLYDIL